MPLIHLTDVTYYPDAEPLVGWFKWSKTPPSPQPRQAIIDHITLTIRHHETLVVVGESGCGKSTLLKLIAGLYLPSSGTVTYNQQPIKEIPIQERRIGMVFQEQALYESMTSEGNIAFYSRVHHQEDQIPQRIKDVSRMMNVELAPLLARHPPKLSGGERQRVAIARALAREFDILLFDEPLANLDVKLKATLRTSMRRIFTQYPVTTVYVTHDISEAMVIADRVAVMHAGKLLQVGTPGELWITPNDTYVADFFGGCNLLPGYVRDDHQWVLGDVHLEAPPAHAPEGARLTLGIRYNDFVVDEAGIFKLRVVHIQHHLDRRIQEIHCVMEKYPLIVELPLETPVGDSLRLSPSKVLWFETATGKRLRY